MSEIFACDMVMSELALDGFNFWVLFFLVLCPEGRGDCVSFFFF